GGEEVVRGDGGVVDGGDVDVVVDCVGVLEAGLGLGEGGVYGEQIEEIRGLVDALKTTGSGEGNTAEGFPELVPLDAVEFIGRGLS
ncbi:hypothetical protein NPN18_24200, partial [Vibrio parahaemolyticus]|nr:hypothetical protein [Vibrio parahaemolyticus]